MSFRSFIRVVYCPPFSRIAVRFTAPDGDGAGAWAWAWARAMRNVVRVRRMSVEGVHVEAMLIRELFDIVLVLDYCVLLWWCGEWKGGF